MTHPKRGLGRGLDALISGGHVPVSAPPPAPPPVDLPVVRRGRAEEIDIDLISPNPEQPRKRFHSDEINELADRSASTASSSR
jgi:ParB family chromosome partitioning protein